MIHLRREIAPISPEVWALIDGEARAALELNLAGRRLVDVEGPKGWGFAAVPSGNVDELTDTPSEGVRVLRRTPQPLIELWTTFELSRHELERAPRSARNIDLAPVVTAAERIARAEDRAIFHGFPSGSIHGISESSTHSALRISEAYASYPATVVEATERLASSGVQGPYALALGPRCYSGLLKASDPNGYPVLSRLQKLIDGPIVRAPAIDGAVVLSARGGDFLLTLGQDFSVGYDSHDERHVRLFLVESLTFQLLSPDAAVPLRYGS